MTPSGWEDSFTRGFRAAVKLWNGGLTWETISYREDYDASAYGRGMYAAVEAMSGWLDLAEREARAWGFSRESAARLVRTVESSTAAAV